MGQTRHKEPEALHETQYLDDMLNHTVEESLSMQELHTNAEHQEKEIVGKLTAFWDKLERINYNLNRIIETKEENIESEIVRSCLPSQRSQPRTPLGSFSLCQAHLLPRCPLGGGLRLI